MKKGFVLVGTQAGKNIYFGTDFYFYVQPFPKTNISLKYLRYIIKNKLYKSRGYKPETVIIGLINYE